MHFIERRARKLARTVFHCMVRFGPGLEKRQAVLGRLVDVGAELFAMAATVSLAVARTREQPGDASPVELADAFCRQARRRVDDSFRAVWHNDDVTTYRVARGVLDGRFTWLERGVAGNL